MTIPRARSPLLVATLAVTATTLCRAQNLETETARLLPAGRWEIGNAFEFQTSAEGTETAVPFAIEYGLTDNLELLVEPVPYTAIRPKIGRHATGLGDVEGTLTYRFVPEGRSRPALALAAEIKFPTAEDSLIGSDLTDYTGYLIASKRLGRIDMHVNVAYSVVGKPASVHLNNIFSFAVAAVYHPTPPLEVFGEVLGNTSSTPGTESTAQNGVVPEAAGGELVGTIGIGRGFGRSLFLYFSMSYDNNNAVLLRPGVTLRVP
jgi:hypothetical protein